MINVFGGTGFIGSRYCELTDNVILNDRDDYQIKKGCSDILYFISTTNNYNVLTDPYIDINTNLVTLIKVLESCNGSDIVFNFVSSWYVYGEQKTQSVKESSVCFPKGFYSITKRTAEQLLISYCETFGIKYRIFRLGNVVGLSDPNSSSKKNILEYLISKVKNNEDIYLIDNGDFSRSYIYIDDVVSAINLIMKKGEKNSIYNVSNYSSDKMSLLIDYAKYKTGSSSKIKEFEKTAIIKQSHIKNMCLDNTKLRCLWYEPTKSVYDVIDDYLEMQ